MARLGQNPLKWISENDRVEDVTVITIVHIPELSGFWKNSLDVLKVCFNSLIENTKESKLIFSALALNNCFILPNVYNLFIQIILN